MCSRFWDLDAAEDFKCIKTQLSVLMVVVEVLDQYLLNLIVLMVLFHTSLTSYLKLVDFVLQTVSINNLFFLCPWKHEINCTQKVLERKKKRQEEGFTDWGTIENNNWSALAVEAELGV